ncbi:MAG TPA: fumarate hydratase [Dehalococcoidia bacterium]|nr:fumarate hydratase [Dehalococcoidia bacterium]
MVVVREIHVDAIRDTVRDLCKDAACLLPEDVVGAIQTAKSREESPVAVKVLDQILLNADLARDEMLPLCQDTGTTVIFLDIGQDVHIVGGDLKQALKDGVGQGYREGFLRASIVDRPFSARTNTKDNTPPIVHVEIVPGDRLRIQVMPKGGGCENMSRFTIMLPSAGKKGITEFVVRTVEESGGNPCPPIIVGLGVGGSAEYAMYMAKRALTRKIGEPNPNPEEAQFEAELLDAVNATGLGAQAVGGTQTALAVHMMTHPTHIASLPVAVNLQCHSARLKEAVL